MLPRVREAHLQNATNELIKIYEYAEWCFKNKARNIWNASGVAFYEHLVDEEVTLKAIPYWVKPNIFYSVNVLFRQRMTEDEYNNLVQVYNTQNKTDFK